MTNRDRLARMSNQELAEEIKSWKSDTCMCPAAGICLMYLLKSCKSTILEWLEMEADKQDA